MNFLAGLQRGAALISALQGLLPVMGALVKSAESLFPNPGSGAQKLDYVMTVVKDVLAFGGAAINDVEAVVPTIVATVNNIVAVAKGAVPPPPVAPAPPMAP